MIPKKHTTEHEIGNTKFFLFKNIHRDYVLFDDSMEYPIRIGKINKIVPILQYYKSKMGNQFVLYQFRDSDREGFVKDTSPLNISSAKIDFPSVGFPTNPVKKTIPKVDKDEIYYHFKLYSGNHILFDSLLNSSIQYGTKLDVNTQYKNMPDSSTVYYFEKNKTVGFKMKMSIKSDKTKKTVEETKQTSKLEKDKNK